MFILGRILQALGLLLLPAALYLGVTGDGSRETAMLEFGLIGAGLVLFLGGWRLSARSRR